MLHQEADASAQRDQVFDFNDGAEIDAVVHGGGAAADPALPAWAAGVPSGAAGPSSSSAGPRLPFHDVTDQFIVAYMRSLEADASSSKSVATDPTSPFKSPSRRSSCSGSGLHGSAAAAAAVPHVTHPAALHMMQALLEKGLKRSLSLGDAAGGRHTHASNCPEAIVQLAHSPAGAGAAEARENERGGTLLRRQNSAPAASPSSVQARLLRGGGAALAPSSCAGLPPKPPRSPLPAAAADGGAGRGDTAAAPSPAGTPPALTPSRQSADGASLLDSASKRVRRSLSREFR